MASATPSRIFASSICQSCRQRLLPQTRRAFRTSFVLRADDPPIPSPSTDNALSALSSSIARAPSRQTTTGASTTRGRYLPALDGKDDEVGSLLNENFGRNLNAATTDKPHKFHVYATKHNTHITLVQPAKPASQTMSSGVSGTSGSSADSKKMVDVLLSLSTGNIGFRKAGRGSYDAAYQLAAFTMNQIREKALLSGVTKMEVVLRGFGAGREAVTKVLLGSEGRNVRGKISSVVDATRLKLGGPRSKKPRRLG